MAYVPAACVCSQATQENYWLQSDQPNLSTTASFHATPVCLDPLFLTSATFPLSLYHILLLSFSPRSQPPQTQTNSAVPTWFHLVRVRESLHLFLVWIRIELPPLFPYAQHIYYTISACCLLAIIGFHSKRCEHVCSWDTVSLIFSIVSRSATKI